MPLRRWNTFVQVCGDLVGISAVVAAMLGLSVLLLTGVLSWRDCLTYPPAWDTLFWFAVLVGAFVQRARRPWQTGASQPYMKSCTVSAVCADF